MSSPRDIAREIPPSGTRPGDVEVLVVVGVRLYREGLASALAHASAIHVIGTAARCEDALEPLEQSRDAIVLLHVDAVTGVAPIHTLTREVPGVRIVVLGLDDGPPDVLACAEAGVAGYVPREASVEDLEGAIRCVARGELACSPLVAGTLLRHIAVLAADRGAPEPAEGALTVREREVLSLIEDGLTNREISEQLTIEVATVKNHVHNILEKLHVGRRSDAVARVHRRRARAGIPSRI
jgi:two-component system nitrate/nitrite response regulator NarL